MTDICVEFGKSLQIDRLRWRIFACICAWSLASSAARAQSVAARFPVTSAQIVAVMQGRQLPTRDVQVRIPAPMTTSVENPQLEIQSVAMVTPREVRLRMACRVQGECLPFFALAAWPQDVSASKLPVTIERSNSGAQPAHADAQPAKLKPLLVAKQPSEAASSSDRDVPPTLRRGAPAMLEIEGDRIHIRLEVISLENGTTGDKIRVTTRDRKQSFEGVVVTPTLLKGSL